MEKGHELRTKDIPAISKAAASRPVKLEGASGVGHGSAIQRQSLCRSGGGGEVDEAVSRIAPTSHIRLVIKFDVVQSQYLPRELVPNHLDIDLLTHLEPEVANEVLIDPGFELTHPGRAQNVLND